MKRRVIRIGVLFAFFLTLLAASGLMNQEIPADVVVETEELLVNEEQQAEPMKENAGTEDITDTVRGILASADRDFFCGYPVSESFLCWIAGRYGQAMLFEIAEGLEGEYDAGLWYDLTGNTMHVLWTDYCKDHGFASYRWKNVVWKDVSDPAGIKLDFIGDICLDDEWCTMRALADGLESFVSSGVKKELQSADLTVANNEFVFTDRERETDAYMFRSEPSNAELLTELGVDAMSLANNHSFDFGADGLLDTMSTLADAGISYSGAGHDSVRYFIMGGRKIAIVSATDVEPLYAHTELTGEAEPVLGTNQESAVLAALAEARANSDYVVAYIHWGGDGKVRYNERQETLARTYAQAGADAVIGGHPHRLQGVAFVGDVPVVYSLGNFWFSSGTLYAAIAQLKIDGDGKLSLRMIPCIQKEFVTCMIERRDDKKEFYHYLADLSSGVGIDESGRVHPFRDVTGPGQSPYAYTSGRRYGLRMDDMDLEGRKIDSKGNLQ